MTKLPGFNFIFIVAFLFSTQAFAAETNSYCGLDPDDAQKSEVACSTAAECPAGENCYIATETPRRERRSPGPSTEENLSTYCGLDPDDAQKSEVACSTAAECPAGEECYVVIATE